MLGTYKTFLFGLDYAGKTSLSQTIIRGMTFANQRPSMAISFDTWEFMGIIFQVWDLPGQITLRAIWKRSIFRTDIFIFLLDTSDAERFEEARDVLFGVVNNKISRGMPLIVCLHKYDLEKSKKNTKLAEEKLNLDQIKDRPLYIRKTSIYDLNSIKKLKETMILIIKKDIETRKEEHMEKNA